MKVVIYVSGGNGSHVILEGEVEKFRVDKVSVGPSLGGVEGWKAVVIRLEP